MAPARLEYMAGTTVTPLLGIPVTVPFDNHVLVLSRQNQFNPNGVRSNHVDLRGRVLTTHDYPTVLNTLAVSGTRLGDEAFLLGHGASAGELQMARFDSVGTLQSDPMTGIPLSGGSASLVELSVNNHIPMAVGIGTELWVVWIRRHRLPDTTIAEELIARPYDRLGNPLAGETIVRSGALGQFNLPKIVANGTAALLGFFDTVTGFDTYHYVTLTRSGIQPISAINPGVITGESFFGPPPGPVATLTSSGIFWNARSFSAGVAAVKGLKVDSGGLPVRTGSGLDFSSEALPGSAAGSNTFSFAGSGISSIPFAAVKEGWIYVDGPGPQTLYELGHFTPGAGAWAATGIFSRSVRVPAEDFLSGNISAYAYSDRLLYVTWSYTEVRVIVVWRRGLDQ
jgi:hypothetical protein